MIYCDSKRSMTNRVSFDIMLSYVYIQPYTLSKTSVKGFTKHKFTLLAKNSQTEYHSVLPIETTLINKNSRS